MTFNVYAMFSFVIVNLTNNYVKHLSPVKPFNKDGNGVTFTFIYKPKMAKEGSFLMHQKNKNIKKKKKKYKIKTLVAN